MYEIDPDRVFEEDPDILGLKIVVAEEHTEPIKLDVKPGDLE